MLRATGPGPEVIVFTASRGSKPSEEAPQYCGGHGAFTCALLTGMKGAADRNKDGTVTIDELSRYLQDKVPELTSNRQIPDVRFEEPDVPMSYPDKSDQPIAWLRHQPPFFLMLSSYTARDPFPQQRRPLPAAFEDDWQRYRALIASNAPASQKDEAALTMSIALEGEGQKVLLQYLRGDAAPPSVDDYWRAAELFERASEIHPSEDELRAKAKFCAGRALIEGQKYDDAEAALREAIALDPRGPFAYNALGIAELRRGKFREAAGQLTKAAELAPRWAYPYHNLAQDYIAMGRYSEAEKAYQQALDRGPNYSYLYLTLGMLYAEQMKRPDKAIATFQRALQVNPSDFQAANHLGVLFQARGDRKSAEAQYRRAAEMAPAAVLPRQNLGRLMLEEGNDGGAEAMAREILALDQGNGEGHDLLGEVFQKRGNLTDAGAEYVMALQSSPNDPELFEHLGDLSMKQNNREAAAAQFRKAIELTADARAKSRLAGKLRSAERK